MWKRKHFVSAQAALNVEVQDEPLPYRFVRVKVRRYVHIVVSWKLQFITVSPVEDLTTKYVCKSIMTVLRASGQVRYADLKYYSSRIGAKAIHLYLIEEQLCKRNQDATLLNIKAGRLTKLRRGTMWSVQPSPDTPSKSNQPRLSPPYCDRGLLNFRILNGQICSQGIATAPAEIVSDLELVWGTMFAVFGMLTCQKGVGYWQQKLGKLIATNCIQQSYILGCKNLRDRPSAIF